MRLAVLVVLAAALAATAAAHSNPTPEDTLAGVIREAMAVVRSLPDDVEQACADLDEAAGKLSTAALFAPTRVIANLVTRAAETDELACGLLRGDGGEPSTRSGWRSRSSATR